MSAGPRPIFVLLVFLGCAAGAVYKLASAGEPDPAVAMRAQEIVRVSGGQAVLVLVEKLGMRRLGVPVSRAEAAQIESALHGSYGVGPASIEALGGRVLRASVDGVISRQEFRGHLFLGSGARELRLDASAGEAVCAALQAGAEIVADPLLLEEAGVTPEDLRGKSARIVHDEPAPAPVLGI
jgi:hypothetical protein